MMEKAIGPQNTVGAIGTTFQNTDPITQYIQVVLHDISCGASYQSDGDGDANHATANRSTISINDAGSVGDSCPQKSVRSQPALGAGNVNVTYKVSRH